MSCKRLNYKPWCQQLVLNKLHGFYLNKSWWCLHRRRNIYSVRSKSVWFFPEKGFLSIDIASYTNDGISCIAFSAFRHILGNITNWAAYLFLTQICYIYVFQDSELQKRALITIYLSEFVALTWRMLCWQSISAKASRRAVFLRWRNRMQKDTVC